MDLRYGTNPHQPARTIDGPGEAPLRVVSGYPSYINLLDSLSAWQLVREAAAATGRVAATSFKHVSPAGAATAGQLDVAALEAWGVDRSAGKLVSAYVRSRDADPKSSFGDMIAVSDPVDAELADLLAGVISDGIIAPGYESGAVARLAAKKSGMFLVLEATAGFRAPQWERRDCHGLLLEQQRDNVAVTANLLGEGSPTAPDATCDALLGLVTARHTQSNSVVLVKDGMAVGIGAGQQNRVDCVRLAAAKARTWWLRRHPHIQRLAFPGGMKRQDYLNWQIRLAEGDMTQRQRTEFEALFPATQSVLAAHDRADWISKLDDLTLVSDGYLPFRDNIDHAASVGVRRVVEPGGSIRSGEVEAACIEYGMTLTRTGLRLFHH